MVAVVVVVVVGAVDSVGNGGLCRCPQNPPAPLFPGQVCDTLNLLVGWNQPGVLRALREGKIKQLIAEAIDVRAQLPRISLIP